MEIVLFYHYVCLLWGVFVMSVQANKHKQPIKVFVLAGQSNMEGMGSLDHLDMLVHNDVGNETTTAASSSSSHDNPYRDALWNETSQSYKVRNDVYIKYGRRMGPLTVGYGYNNSLFGPELMVGWELANALHNEDDNEEPIIYLIKACWGGMDLAIDFRSPSSGRGHYPDVLPSHYGWRYRDMAQIVRDGLQQIASVIPQYDESIGYQLSGMVWFQGWNDVLDAHKVAEYASNLANLLRDVADEWEQPDLPVVVGEMGVHGIDVRLNRAINLRQAQRKVPAMPEFNNRSLFVPTSQYVVPDDPSFNGAYHYYGRAVRIRIRVCVCLFVAWAQLLRYADIHCQIELLSVAGHLLSHWKRLGQGNAQSLGATKRKDDNRSIVRG